MLLLANESFAREGEAVARALGEMGLRTRTIPIRVVLGPDHYLFGEETGLEEVIEGRLPLPRTARPFIQGLFAPGPGVHGGVRDARRVGVPYA